MYRLLDSWFRFFDVTNNCLFVVKTHDCRYVCKSWSFTQFTFQVMTLLMKMFPLPKRTRLVHQVCHLSDEQVISKDFLKHDCPIVNKHDQTSPNLFVLSQRHLQVFQVQFRHWQIRTRESKELYVRIAKKWFCRWFEPRAQQGGFNLPNHYFSKLQRFDGFLNREQTRSNKSKSVCLNPGAILLMADSNQGPERTLCQDCKEMILQVVRAQSTARRLQFA